jgi:iron-sulfur cluster assembly protein
MFSMTPAAVNEVLAAAQRSSAAGMALRVAARQAADGAIEFGMGFDDEREDDEAAHFDTLKVLIGAPSKPLLEGAVLDCVETGPGQLDFVFTPAPEPVVAGCGSAEPKPRGGCGGGSCGSGSCGA